MNSAIMEYDSGYSSVKPQPRPMGWLVRRQYWLADLLALMLALLLGVLLGLSGDAGVIGSKYVYAAMFILFIGMVSLTVGVGRARQRSERRRGRAARQYQRLQFFLIQAAFVGVVAWYVAARLSLKGPQDYVILAALACIFACGLLQTYRYLSGRAPVSYPLFRASELQH